MAAPIVLSPQTAYATKDNIVAPMTQTQATAAEGFAKNRIEAAVPNVTVTVASGAVVPED